MDPRRGAVLLLVATALLWSIGGVFIKSVDWNPLAIAGGRSAIAAVYLLAFVGRPRLAFSWPVFGAAACYAATMLLYVPAVRLTTAANAILLEYLAPLHVAVLAPRFLGEPTLPRDWAALAAALGGMCLFFWGEVSAQGQAGNLLALASSLSFAGLAMCMRKIADGRQAEAILWGNVLSAVCCLPFYFQGPAPDATSLWWLLVLGVVQTGMPYQLYARAIRHVRAMEIILIPVMEPILNPLWVFLFLGERPSAPALAGGLLVLGAATLQGLLAARAPAGTRRRAA